MSSAKTPTKTHQTAVVIIPPEDCWYQIQEIRKKNDKAYMRWMPHINLLYPFLPEDSDEVGKNFQSVAARMLTALRDVKSFHVLLSGDSVGSFTQSRASVMWLKPLFVKSTVVQEPVASTQDKQNKIKKTKKSVLSSATTNPLNSEPQKVAQSAQIYQPPEPSPKPGPESLSEPSIDNLRYAIWHPGKTPSSSCCVGMDALRSAVWGPGERDSTHSTILHENEDMISKGPGIVGNDTWMNREMKDWSTGETFVIRDNDTPVSKWNEFEAPEDDWRSSSDDDVTSSSDDDTEEEVQGKEGEIHPSIFRLHSKLLSIYPDHDDLVRISPDGKFKPHITLGQCPNSRISRMTEENRRIFDGKGRSEFLIDRIHIITRRSQYDPFVIRATIPLGSNTLTLDEAPPKRNVKVDRDIVDWSSCILESI